MGESASPREFQAGGALVSSLSLEAADLDKVPVSMLVPMHAALGTAAQMAAVAFSASSEAFPVLAGICEAAKEMRSLPAAALIEHPLRALIVARRACRGDLVRNGEVVESFGVNSLELPQSSVLGDPARACIAAAVACDAVSPSEAALMLFERHGALSTLLGL